MNITYYLFDNGGANTLYDMPIKLPVGAKFETEYGWYWIEGYRGGGIEAVCHRTSAPKDGDNPRKGV